jgi:hypothetical protein
MKLGCPFKYGSTNDEIDKLNCKREEISKVWEPNVKKLVYD